MKSITNYAVIIPGALLFASCSTDPERDNTFTATESLRFITPALQDVDIPFEKTVINADAGDTVYYSTGSVIIFPPNSLLDKNGVVVSGNVDIFYREFSDPLDFFLSGIPMSYDSSGNNYIFESAAMMEIYASKNNEPIFVNPMQRPEVNLASTNKDDQQNIYYLDTLSGQWKFKGKDQITDLTFKPVFNTVSLPEQIELIPPQRPEKADPEKSSFIILIEPGTLKEVQVYNNMKFEIDDEEKNFKPERDVEYWDNVQVENTAKRGTFRVTFINKNKTVSYLGRPVYDGKDYEEALKEFELKQKEYEGLLSERITAEEKIKKEIEKQNLLARIEKEKIERINKLLEKREKEVEENNRKILEAENKKREEQRKIYNEWLAVQKKKDEIRQRNAFANGGTEMSGEIIRTFTLDGFGIWNIDKPVMKNTVTIAAEFRDKEGKKLNLKNINIVYSNFNGIYSCTDNQVNIIPGTKNMILGVSGNTFAYFSSKDFFKCKIDSNTTEFTFTMNLYEGVKSREEIRKIVGL